MRLRVQWFNGWTASRHRDSHDSEEEEEEEVKETEIEAELEYNQDDLKEILHSTAFSTIPICRMLLFVKGRDPLTLATGEDRTLGELGLRENDVILVKDNQGTGPPYGIDMVRYGLVRSPSVNLLDDTTSQDSAPVLRCRPFVVQSLRFTPFVVEFNVDNFRQTKTPAYAHGYLASSHLDVVEFLQPPRFDSRWGSRAGAATGGWRQVCSQHVQGPSLFGPSPNLREPTPREEASGLVRVSIIPPTGWKNGTHYHVVLVAEGPFDEMRGLAWAFKVRLRKRSPPPTPVFKRQKTDEYMGEDAP